MSSKASTRTISSYELSSGCFLTSSVICSFAGDISNPAQNSIANHRSNATSFIPRQLLYVISVFASCLVLCPTKLTIRLLLSKSADQSAHSKNLSRSAPLPIRPAPPIHSNRLAVGRIVLFGEIHLLRIILEAFDLICGVAQKRLLVLVEGEIVLSDQPVLQ